jgi:hypothetical protein
VTHDELKVRCEALATVGDQQAAATLDLMRELQATAKLSCDNLEKLRDSKNEEIAKLKERVREMQSGNMAGGEVDVRQRLMDTEYILSRIRGTMTLADSLLRGALTRDRVMPPESVATGRDSQPKSDLQKLLDKGHIIVDTLGPHCMEEPLLPPDHAAVAKKREPTRPIEEPSAAFEGVKINGQRVEDLSPVPTANVPLPRQMGDNRLKQPDTPRAATPEETAAVAAVAREFGVSDTEARSIQQTRKNMGLPPTVDAAVTRANTDKPAGSYDKTPKMGDAAGNKPQD